MIMPDTRRHGLSKSRYVDGAVQCHKKLWLRVHEPTAAELEVGPAQQALFDHGAVVGDLAREQVPGGVLIDLDRQKPADAIAATRSAIESGASVIYEASFSHEGAFAAVDILAREQDGWRLIEVKSSCSTKPVHLEDVAFQIFVLRECGLLVHAAEVMHLSREYRHPVGELFVREDVTEAVEKIASGVPNRVAALRTVLEGEMPDIEVGPHCRKPYPCPFVPRCTAVLPSHHVTELFMGHAKLAKLRDRGCTTIGEIPDSVKLTAVQQRQRKAVRGSALVVEPGLRDALTLPGPFGYFDIETLMLPIPVFPGCWPWMSVPAQWSLHTDGPAGLGHDEFLAQSGDDPRRPFAAALVEATTGLETVFVWHASFELQRLAELAIALPDLARGLERLASRIVDLLPIVRRHVYHPDFRGSFSLKRVLPALCPGNDWSHLDIGEGATASAVLERVLLRPKTLREPERKRTRTQLRDYCRLDTWALVLLHRTLMGLEFHAEPPECAPGPDGLLCASGGSDEGKRRSSL